MVLRAKHIVLAYSSAAVNFHVIEARRSCHCTKAQREPARHHRKSEDFVRAPRIFRLLNGEIA
jgi:hypothetical protein